MRTAASRFRTGATFAALTLGATACASGSDGGSGLAAPASTTGEDNADGSAGVSAADGGQSNAPGEDAASPTSNGPGLTPNMPGAESGADTRPDSGAAPAADGGSGSTSPPPGGDQEFSPSRPRREALAFSRAWGERRRRHSGSLQGRQYAAAHFIALKF